MVRGLFSSASGMQYLHLKQEVTANNIANIATTGFKRADAFRRTLVNAESLMQMHAGEFRRLEEVDEVATDYSPGSFQVTHAPLDCAIQGDGFFTVQTAEGPRYTRNGNFIRGADGTLMTTNGHVLLGRTGPVQVNGEDVFIGDDGSVVVDGVGVDALRITSFPPPYALEHLGDGEIPAVLAPDPHALASRRWRRRTPPSGGPSTKSAGRRRGSGEGLHAHGVTR